ncbi:SDR family NAD(P)-dependent oxidoreductase, partial [Nocardia sp. NPDC088792]|uniref:SDR family NAD(P)-dependent oxidoreductase n=1 Tax=Nocardia sp. NPDC088792 TaxID=3364332 RepID=UPI0037F615ED
MERASHPLLGGVLSMPDGRVVLTSRLSVGTQPWLADHAVNGVVLFPGTGIVELALRAGDMVGCGRVTELVIEVPLILPERGAIQMQVVLDAPAEGSADSRHVSIYGRIDGSNSRWVRHASGLVSVINLGTEALLQTTPPESATEIDLAGVYERIAAGGFVYGPSFQGLTQVWRDGEHVYAEVVLPAEQWGRASEFGIHPALLDALLHATLFVDLMPVEFGRLPFSFSDVVLHAFGATRVWARLTVTGPDSLSVVVTDAAGGAVLSIGSLVVRPVTPHALTAAATRTDETVLSLDLEALPLIAAPRVTPTVVTGPDRARGDVREVTGAGLVVLAVSCAGMPSEAAHRACAWVLDQLQKWLAEPGFSGSKLVVLTRRAVDCGDGDVNAGVSAVWGLARSAQAEHPGRIVVVDVDDNLPDGLLAAILASGEPQVIVRGGTPHVLRLAPVDEGMVVPDNAQWHLETVGGGTLEGLRLQACESADLGKREVRVSVHAAGVNFRDVLNALGMYPVEGVPLGGEVAGVVTEVGDEVTDLCVGDRVMGLAQAGFGPVVTTDHRLVVRIPRGWSFVVAASVPTVFLTAWYGLVDLAGLSSGERVLVHAGAGGVGMAAVQIARHFGAEVFATASEAKWPSVCDMGVDPTHVASSRTTAFAATFSHISEGRGVNVVLNSLSGEFIDASLNLLAPGGRFVEMGKTDVRDAAAIAAAHGGAIYRTFDLTEAGPDRVRQILTELVSLFESGALTPLPIKDWNVRQAQAAFRYMSQAKHIGKIVLRIPHGFGDGAVLVTGGTGGLGSVLARHLVAEHGVRDLVLVSRRGAAAPGANELVAELTELGALVTLEACDVSDFAKVEELVRMTAARTRLAGVVHTAAVVDDGVLSSLSPVRLGTVLGPKAAAAWYLHEATRDLDLDVFAVFSSLSGLLGAPGQGNYAAANVFLDALMAYRRRLGLPGVSMVWGPWTPEVGMTHALSEADISRIHRSGMPPLSTAAGMRLFDRALTADKPLVALARVDAADLAAQDSLPPILAGLVGPRPPRAVAATAANTSELATLSPQRRAARLLELVREHVAVVLGHTTSEALSPTLAFRDAGFDSLTAVELRNRLQTATGLTLPATLTFDYPNAARLADHLIGYFAETTQDEGLALPAPVSVDDDPIVVVGTGCRFPGGVTGPDELWDLVTGGIDGMTPFPGNRGWKLDGLHDPTRSRTDTTIAAEGGFVATADEFDAAFFGISPREAVAMDPQQRLLLEVAWEALEHAGIDPASLAGSRTGVFIGSYHSAYSDVINQADEKARAQMMTGAAQSIVSGRVAYVLGLEGPAVTVDTACSSSLVAMHWAAQSLRSGESSLVLAGGVTVMATPGTFVEFTRQGGLAA